MLNNNPQFHGSIPSIEESSLIVEKVSNVIKVSLEDIEDKSNDLPRQYGLSMLLRHFVCCSCLSAEHSDLKYKSASPGHNDTFNILPSKVNGKRKLNNDSKSSHESKSNDESKDTLQDHDVAISSQLAQNISASNVFNHDLKDEDSQNLGASWQSSTIYSKSNSLLPEISPKNLRKKCFIIDLDETLVHSSFKFVRSADINVEVEIDGVQHEVFVCKRPYVDEFLAELGDLFECVLFTASLGKYAGPVTDILDSRGIFEARLFREACAFKDGNYIKDLDAIGRDIDQILILDNSPVSYLLHPRHALQIVSWFDDPSDTALRDLIPYFKDLAASDLSVPEWFDQNRPPESAGILGHPPSNLHWILMQTLSVPEAVHIYKQRLRESYYAASGSSNVSRQSSARASVADGHEPAPPHHGLITQVANTARLKSSTALDSDDDRPPVSSPVARLSSVAICLNDDLNDEEVDELIGSHHDQEVRQLCTSSDKCT